jgi:anti-anti-sigma factor
MIQVEVAEHVLSVFVIRLAGRVDASIAAGLKTFLKDMHDRNRDNLVLDLRDVTFIDSLGLSVFTSALRAARAAGGDICFVVTPDSPVEKILSIVRFDRVFQLYETVEQARSSFRL